MTKEEFRDRLNELIKQHGLTHAKIALEVGCSKTTVTRWAEGRNAPNTAMRKAIIKILEIAVGAN
jgi:transcriptional regulator with XRE-family HTH domain